MLWNKLALFLWAVDTHWLFVTTEILSSWFSGDDFQEGRAGMDIHHGEKMHNGDITGNVICLCFKVVKKLE